MVNRRLRLEGSLWPRAGGREVILEQRIAGEWNTIRRVAVRQGRFETDFRPKHRGFRLIRATLRRRLD